MFTYRRDFFLNFLKYNFIKPKRKSIKFEVTECIKYQIKKTIKDHIVDLVEFKFENTIKIGYLKKYCIKVLKNIFVEKFTVLCNIGIIYFDANDFVPRRVIPLVGSTINKVN